MKTEYQGTLWHNIMVKKRRCIIPLGSIIAIYTDGFLIQLTFKIIDNQSQKVNGHLRLI